MTKLPKSGVRGKRWSTARRFNGWLATWAQDRRRGRLLPAPVLAPQYPSLAAWSWSYANPARWNAYNSLDGGLTYQFDDWVVGSARQYAPDGGDHLMFIVGVDANGNEITHRSNAVRPDDANPALLTGLAAYWKMDETDAVGFMPRQDELGNSDVVPMLQEILSVPGVLGNAVDSYAAGSGLGGSSGAMSLAGDFSVSIWFFLNEHYTWQIAFHLYDSLTNAECFRIQMYGPFDPGGAAPYVQLDGFGGGFLDATYYPGDWIHTVVSVAGNVMSVYANGSLVDVVTLTGGVRRTPNTVFIGANQAGYGWFGPIDEVGFWNRALSVTEVTQLYNSGNGLSYDWF